MALQIDVAFRTEDIAQRDLTGQTVVVLDILRATSTIVTALGAGALAVYPAAEVDEARAVAEDLRGQGKDVLLCGERGGLPPDDFDLGNSPRDYTPDRVCSKHLVLTTTNGTRLLNTCLPPTTGARMKGARGPEAVLIGATLNRMAVAETVQRLGKPVVFACAGTEGRFSLDDVCGAGCIIRSLLTRIETDMTDAATAATELYLLHQSHLSEFLKQTCHGNTLVGIGLEADLPVCSAIDTESIAPRYRNGAIEVPK